MDDKTCAREWARRPEDERFLSFAEIGAAARSDRECCKETRKATRQLHVVASGNSVMLNGGQQDAGFTNWSFSQFCSQIGAPTRYLTSLPAELAAECCNHGLSVMAEEKGRTENALLLRTTADGQALTLRAMTSTSYVRAWDAPIIDTVRRFTEGEGSNWRVPASWPGKQKPGGLYRSDRDMFLYLTNGGSIVNDPTVRDGNGQMFRGFIVRNSEVGAASLSISTFLLRWTCGNHIIGGLTDVKEYRRRHVGTGLTYLADEALRHVARWIDTPASRDEQRIQQLADYEIGKTKEDVIAALRGRHGFTESQATAAYETAERTESCSPRSAWGIAQGTTRNAQGKADDPILNDERWTLDTLAGQLLARVGRQLVAC